MTRIDERYELTSKIFDDNRTAILTDIQISKYKQSAKAIYRQQEKIGTLLKAMMNIANEDDSF